MNRTVNLQRGRNCTYSMRRWNHPCSSDRPCQPHQIVPQYEQSLGSAECTVSALQGAARRRALLMLPGVLPGDQHMLANRIRAVRRPALHLEMSRNKLVTVRAYAELYATWSVNASGRKV